MRRRHEGDESARIAARWLECQPSAFLVARGARDELLGFVATFALEEASAAEVDWDPAIRAAWTFARDGGRLREGDTLVYHRFHLSCDAYQDISPVSNVLGMCSSFAPLDHPRLGWSFVQYADPVRATPIMRYVHFDTVDEANFEVDGRHYGVFAHDWRSEPFDAWWDALGEGSMTEPAS